MEKGQKGKLRQGPVASDFHEIPKSAGCAGAVGLAGPGRAALGLGKYALWDGRAGR